MAKCKHCQVKKGKRACPYLSGTICAACCGENRQTVFSCPETCVYLHAADTYQMNRSAAGIREKYQARYAGYVNSGRESLAHHVYLLEGILFRMAIGKSGIDDAEVLAGLEYLHRIFGPVTTLENFPSRLGRDMQEELEKLSRGEGGPHRHEIPEAVDELMSFLKTVSTGRPGSRDYLTLLQQAGTHLKFTPDPEKSTTRPSGIILP